MIARVIVRITGWLLLVITIVVIGLVILYRYVPPPITPLMIMRAVEGYGIDKAWRDLDAMSPDLVAALIAAEDMRFCSHNGIDWIEVEAAWQAAERGARLRGASTLSMQAVKNLFLWPGRDWIRKGMEAMGTLVIETAWPKRRIVELYLNVVEFGPGIYGVEAAARHYFKTSAKSLSKTQAIALISVLPNPLDRSPVSPSARTVRYIDHIRRRVPTVDRDGLADCISGNN